MTEEATLSALVHGKQTAISFRHLSSLLNVSTRKAQALLCQFAESNPTVTSLWCVTESHPKTGVIRTSLTTKPSPTGKKRIWAVGPPSAANPVSQQAQWLATDAARDRKLVAEPSHVQNELRDGRWDRVKCHTAHWDAKLDPRLGGDQNFACGLLANRSNSKPNSSSLLASVKAKTKGKRTKAKDTFLNGTFKPSSRPTTSLFASKPLGADAVKKMHGSASAEEKENGKQFTPNHLRSLSPSDDVKHSASGRKKTEIKKKARKRTPSKQPRKVQDNHSDHEDPPARPPLEEEEPDEDEQQECLRELEREAAEREKADAERAELEKELMDLNREDADEDPDEDPESPELKDLGESGQENCGTVSPVPQPEELDASPGPGKRSFWRTFGDTPDAAKRIRKEVEETVEENGYIVTRRVVKIFDEHGNELKDSPAEKTPIKSERAPRMSKSEPKEEKSFQPKTSSPTNDTLSKSNLAKDKTRDPKRTISKPGTTSKKTPKKKKKKGSIMSYFGKKM